VRFRQLDFIAHHMPDNDDITLAQAMRDYCQYVTALLFW
jgi:hypothetical protein